MKKSILLLVMAAFALQISAQKKTTTSAIVTFDATTEKDALPKAENKTVIGSIDLKTGDIAFEAAVKNFSFSNPKMHDHFNGDNWFKSDTYPVFSYSGKIEKFEKLNLSKDGVYKVTVKGQMTIRDITKSEKIEGTITVSGGKISVASAFSIKLEDYKITGMPIDAGKVHKEPRITVSASF